MKKLKFLVSKRGGRMVFFKSFKYNFGSTYKKDVSIRWRYVMRKCNAKIIRKSTYKTEKKIHQKKLFKITQYQI